MPKKTLWLSAALVSSLAVTAPAAAQYEDAGTRAQQRDDRRDDRADRRDDRRDDRADRRDDRRDRRAQRRPARRERRPARAERAPARSGRVDINTPHQGSRPFQLDVHAGFTWWGLGFASGVRLGIPIMDNGFIDSINNAVYLNFGADFYFIQSHYRCDPGDDRRCGWDYGPGFGFPVTLHWEFYFNESWSAFAEIGAQFFVHPRWLDDGNFGWHQPGAWFVWTVGGSYHVTENFLLTLRVGSPYVAFGLTFQF